MYHGYSQIDNSWGKTDTNVNLPLLYNKLYFIESGEGTEVMPTGKVNLKKNHAYLFPLKTKYNYFTDSYIRHFFIHFNFSLYNFLDIFDLYKLKTYEIKYDFNKAFKILSKYDNNNIIDKLYIKSFLIQILLKFVDKNIKIDVKKFSFLEKYKDIIDYINNNLGNDLTLEKIAEQALLTPAYLSYSFKHDLGINIKQYINDKIVEKAANLLITTSKKVKEISRELHFSDEFYFSKFFKKYTFSSPGKYRKNHD